MTKSITINVSSRRYEDYDDCLSAAASDFVDHHPGLEGWDLAPRWGDDARTTIELTVPRWAVENEGVTA